jgi:hypothetical protein
MNKKLKQMNPILRNEVMSSYWDRVNFELLDAICKNKRDQHNETIRKRIHNKLVQLRVCSSPMLRNIIKDDIKRLQFELL